MNGFSCNIDVHRLVRFEVFNHISLKHIQVVEQVLYNTEASVEYKRDADAKNMANQIGAISLYFTARIYYGVCGIAWHIAGGNGGGSLNVTKKNMVP